MTVYTIQSSTDYHSAACPLRKSFPSTALTFAQAEARGLPACLLCRPHERDAGVAAVLQQSRAAIEAEAQKEKDAVSVARRRELATRTETEGTVFSMQGSSSYHLASCELAARFRLEPTTYRDARDKGLTACTLCNPDAHPVVKNVIENTSLSHVYYVSTTAAVVRKEPIATSPILGRLTPLESRSIYEVRTGWVRVQVGKAENPKGWVRATEENLAPGDSFDAAYGIVKMEDKPWPVATKVAILRRVAKIGFTREQVTLALGDPQTKAVEETAAGTTESWAYAGRVITFKDGRVAAINTAQGQTLTSAVRSTPTTVPPGASTPSPIARDLAFRVTERNDTFWRFGWKFSLQNTATSRYVGRVEIEFHDSDGFVIDTATEYNVAIAPSEIREFTGQALIKAETAPRVTQIKLKYHR